MTPKSAASKVLSLFLIVALLLPTIPSPIAQAISTPAAPEVSPPNVSPLASVAASPPTSLPASPPSPPPQSPALALSVVASPEEVPAGEAVTFTVRLANAGDAVAHGIVVSGTLPAGLECPNCEPFYSPGNRKLQWTLGTLEAGQALTLTFAAQVELDAGWEGGTALSLSARGVEVPRPAHGSGVVRVPYPVPDGPAEAALPPGQEGQLVSADGRLTVTFPVEAVPVNLTVSYSPTTTPTAGYFHPLRRFHVEAYDPGGQEVHDFPAPVRIVYRYTRAEVLGLDPSEQLLLARWEEDRGTWVRLPSEVDEERQLLVGWTDHFSEIGGGYFKLPSDDYLPQVQGFQEIDLFSGAASYSYPIAVPPARGGFGPQLGLSYSSGSVDWPASPWDSEVQAGWVGYGWSLEASYIGRQNVGGWNWFEQEGKCQQGDKYAAGDAYNLVLDGAGHDLVSGTNGYYHTAAETYWQVWNSGEEPHPEAWYVRTKSGAVYTFSTRLWQLDCDGECYGMRPPSGWDHQVYKWLLTEAQDLHGNTIHYTYTLSTVDCPNPGGHGTFACQEAYYLSEIGYNFNGNTALTKIEFDTAEEEEQNRGDLYAPHDDSRCPAKFLQKKKLDAIRVWMNGQLVRKYNFSYDYSTVDDDLDDWVQKGKLTLKSVQMCGGEDPGNPCLWPLPATSFKYYPTGTQENPQVGRNRLQSVSNGYGGVVTYTYELVSEVNDWRNRVAARALVDGLQHTDPFTWTYVYTPALRNSPFITNTACQGISYDAGTSKPRTRPMQEFRGHDTVTVTDPLGNVQVHFYDQSDTFRGKETQTIFLDNSAQHKRMRYVARDYGYIPTTAASDQGGYTFSKPEIAFTYLFTETDYTCDGHETCKSRKTANYYDTAYQGGGQYGNLTRVEAYDENGALYRTTLRVYYPNTTAWIVGLAGYENIYAGSTAVENVRSSTYYAYDGLQPFNAPTKGDLTRLIQVLAYPTKTAQVRYDYDDYGNRTKERVYECWAACAIESCPEPTCSYRDTTIAYNDSEAGYHLYPEKVTYPNGRSESATYDYVKGVILSHTDVNNDTTSYVYDALGRVNKVIRPGDSTITPTVQVSYFDFGTPGSQRVEVKRREVSGQAGTLDAEQYFDGLGRSVQTHAEAEDGQEIIATTLYDELGQTWAEVVPYLATGSSTYLSPPQDQPRTRYAYDSLGRTVVVTNTDDTTVRTYYDYWQTAAVDQEDHLAIQESDAFGRMIWVREYTETIGGDLDWDDLPDPYAETEYAYDVRDQLVAITDTAGNVTGISYDFLGRKVAMDDPDMGDWTYDYDALGNMITQTDAKNQSISFEYDDMNRMTLKNLPGDYPDVHLCYDDCEALDLDDAGETNSWGRLRWTWVGGDAHQNAHAYAYDARGRTVSDTVFVDEVGYNTQYTYDAMDRVTTMTYPDGEVVTTTYDVRGSPYSLVGATDYVTRTTYNAQGQTTLLGFGSGLQTTYLYDDSGAAPSYRLKEIQTGPSGSLQRLEYLYRCVGLSSSTFS